MAALLNKNELMKELQISKNTLEKFRSQGMPCIKIGKQVRFDRTEVLEWFKRQQGRD